MLCRAVVFLALGHRGSGSLQAEYGGRWAALAEALARPKRHAVWANPFATTAVPWRFTA